MNLKGRVKSVTLHQTRDSWGGERHERWEFRQDGRCVHYEGRSRTGKTWNVRFEYDEQGYPLNDGSRNVRQSDGSRLEITSLISGARRADTWTTHALHGIGLPTHGASTVATKFDARGTPTETTFESEDGEVARIAYIPDEVGRIAIAVQHTGQYSSLSQVSGVLVGEPTRDSSGPANLDIGAELCRVAFTYDLSGRVTTSDVQWLSGPHAVTKHAYNEQGDPAETSTDGNQPVRFAYEYDNRQNWIRKQVYHSAGMDEQLREVEYYD